MSINIPTAHSANIVLAYGKLQSVVEWCERNCTGDWRYMENITDPYNCWQFFFESDRDYIAFTLWNK